MNVYSFSAIAQFRIEGAVSANSREEAERKILEMKQDEFAICDGELEKVEEVLMVIKDD